MNALLIIYCILSVGLPSESDSTRGVREGQALDGPPTPVWRLESPVDYQVFQRQTMATGQVRVRGQLPAGADAVEVQIQGEWLPIVCNLNEGTFNGELKVPAGGWYVCRARATKAGAVLASTEVAHVGVGEVFVIAGQSNSANHGEERQQVKTGRVAAFDGTRWQIADDPQPGASGNGGSFLPPFGDAMASRCQVPVGLVACGIGATSVREWLPKGATFPQPPTLTGRVRQLPSGSWESQGEAYAMFVARMKQLGRHGFRAVLWHQGESDANQQDPTRTLPGALYRRYLEQLIRESRREIGWEAPWFVAQVSYHVPGDEASPEIRAAQKSLWESGLALEGPDSDALKNELRESQGKGVHFSGEGLRQHAARWVEKVGPWLETGPSFGASDDAWRDVVRSVPRPPEGALGFPSRDPHLDVWPGFQNPPPGYGEVPFWWWTGDALNKERLLWQIEELHKKGISGMQVNYAHEDSPGWPTYAVEPELFSEAWWEMWKFVAGECGQRGMGIGLSGYTLDWPNGKSLVSRTIYNNPEIQGREIEVARKTRVAAGQAFTTELPADVISVRAYPVGGKGLGQGSLDLSTFRRDQRLEWQPVDGEWEVWILTAARKPGTLNPLHPLAGRQIVERFLQPFQDHAPGQSAAGLNYFFQDELQFGVGDRIWADDLPAEFKRRKGYDLFEALPAMFQDAGPRTAKCRLDFMDVKMQLAQERYFIPIFQWHWSRGKIYGCDQGSRGRDPVEFGDYFSSVRWYTAPGHDTPGGTADLIKGKVSSSIAQLYQRPRVWLEGYHSLGWGATPENLMFATRENYLYGCNLLNLHGLYYSTHGSFWEWAPPCYHFRMPYWEHMGTFLKYFERLSYLLSQGVHQCDVAVLYPVAPNQAKLGGSVATDTAFAVGTTLMNSGRDFIFMDSESLERSEIRDGRLHVSDASYRVLVLPAMQAIRWSSLLKAQEFYRAGGIVLAVGALPEASDRVGRDDVLLDASVKEMFGQTGGETLASVQATPQRSAAGGIGLRVQKADQALLGQLGSLVPGDVQTARPVKALHRKVGPRDVYMVMGAAKNSVAEFRARGQAELWDPWTGKARALRVLGETETGTKVELPLEEYEAQIVVFNPGRAHTNPSAGQEGPGQKLALNGEWEFELQPTMDNRFGDFRLPVTEKIIGPEARLFRHAVEGNGGDGWQKAEFDDRGWERTTYDFGPQFWVLGPLTNNAAADALELELAKLTRVNPAEALTVEGRSLTWRPYQISWRQGLEGDPGHQGWHGLKENVTDHFLCLGKRVEGMNELKYEAEEGGSRYYLWTSVTVDGPTPIQIQTSAPREGAPPHASHVLTPAAVILNGVPVKDHRQAISLKAGSNPILVRYDQPGRGYFVVRKDDAPAKPAPRTPLAMSWFDDPSVIPFDVHAGARSAEWFRFTAPPGFRAMKVTARGNVQAWADGRLMRAVAGGRFETDSPLARAAVVALRAMPEIGVSGGAVFPEPIRMECGAGFASAGDWSKAGALECYSGGAWYRKTVTLTPEQARDEIFIDLGKVVATAEVRVNGQVAGIRVAPPWRLDISPWVKPGENRIEILVFNTLANHYLTIPTRYRGGLTSGLLGPVSLELNRLSTNGSLPFK